MKLAQGKEMRVISQQELKEKLFYDPLTGIFTRIKATGTSKIGDMAGCLSKTGGYIYISLNNKRYLAHRLAWLYQTGIMPKDMIDHKNEIKTDNRICNLREANKSQNMQNQNKPQKSNKSGLRGVSFHSQANKYAAEIIVDGNRKRLGLFATPELASAAYIEAKRQYHEFCTI